MSTSELYYTNEKLNRQWEQAFEHATLSDFNTNTSHMPLDYLHLTSLPPAVGALTLPPMGKYSTPVNVTGGMDHSAPVRETDRTQLYAVAALVAAYLAFLPM